MIADATSAGFDVIPYVVNGGAMALLAWLLSSWLPKLVKAFEGLTRAIKHNTETIEIQGRAMIVLSTKIDNPDANLRHQGDSVSAEFDRANRRAADEDSDNRG